VLRAIGAAITVSPRQAGASPNSWRNLVIDVQTSRVVGRTAHEEIACAVPALGFLTSVSEARCNGYVCHCHQDSIEVQEQRTRPGAVAVDVRPRHAS
jgi:hypothetical protein